jgi:hypothetical protein
MEERKESLEKDCVFFLSAWGLHIESASGLNIAKQTTDHCGVHFIWSTSTTNHTALVIFLSKVHQRSLNLRCCVIPVPKLVNRPFRSSNLFICVIWVLKLVLRCHPGP